MITNTPEHTIEIDDFKCIGFSFQSEIPYQKRVFNQVDIEDGLPKKYPGGWELRKVTFQAELSGPYLEIQDQLNKLVNKRVRFTSIYIGSFYCLMNWSLTIEDGTPGEQLISFEIEEVADDAIME